MQGIQKQKGIVNYFKETANFVEIIYKWLMMRLFKLSECAAYAAI